MPYSQLSLDGKRTNQEIRVGGVCELKKKKKRHIKINRTVYVVVDKSNNYSFVDLLKFPLPFTLFSCYEGPNKKGVKSRKGLSWDFWHGFMFSLKLVHFPMHAKNKTREVQLCLERFDCKELSCDS